MHDDSQIPPNKYHFVIERRGNGSREKGDGLTTFGIEMLNWMRSVPDDDGNHVRTYSLLGARPVDEDFPEEDREDICQAALLVLAQPCAEKFAEKQRDFLAKIAAKHPNGFAIQAVSMEFVLTRESKWKTATGLVLLHCDGFTHHGQPMYLVKPGGFDLFELKDVCGSLMDTLNVVRSQGFVECEWPSPYFEKIDALLEVNEFV